MQIREWLCCFLALISFYRSTAMSVWLGFRFVSVVAASAAQYKYFH